MQHSARNKCQGFSNPRRHNQIIGGESTQRSMTALKTMRLNDASRFKEKAAVVIPSVISSNEEDSKSSRVGTYNVRSCLQAAWEHGNTSAKNASFLIRLKTFRQTLLGRNKVAK